MDCGEDRRFKASFTGEGQAMLKVRVNEKLKELMGDYTDDTLAEYATVLIRNGRSRSEVATELHVFLGDDNDAFVSWLWNHLSSNLHLYFQPIKAVSSNDAAKGTRIAAGSVPSLTSSVQTNHEPEAETQKVTGTRKRREWGGMLREQGQAVPLRSVVASVSYADEKSFHGSHAEDKRFHKSHSVKRTRSPDRHSQKKKSREDDERSTKRASHQVIDAPRRLLQFAVRDAVRPVQPMASRSESGSKRLCSAVSTMASDSIVDDTNIRLNRANLDLRVPGSARALRPVAAAEDVLKHNFSRNVFNRLGLMPTINHSERSLHREQDRDDEEVENIDRARAENQAEFHRRNDYGGGDAYMYDRKTQEVAGSAPNIDKYDNNSAVRFNGVVPRRGTLPSGGEKESLVVGYVRGAAEVSSRRPIAQGTHADSGPRPSAKILNASANTTTCHDTRDAATFMPQVPVEKKSSDARKPNAIISHVNDVTMTDKAKDSIHLSSMVEAQKASSIAAGSGSTGQPEDVNVNDCRTIFVTNVHFGASKDALSRHFNKFGPVLKTIIVTDGVTGQPTGSAYIEFLHKESAEQALALNGTSFMSRILKVVRRSTIEVPQQTVWPRPRGSPYASRLIRTAYPRPSFPGAIRGRLPLRGGSRSLQWKRDAVDSADAGKYIQATPAAPGNQFVTSITRSFTYTRTEPKPNDGAMV